MKETEKKKSPTKTEKKKHERSVNFHGTSRWRGATRVSEDDLGSLRGAKNRSLGSLSGVVTPQKAMSITFFAKHSRNFPKI